MAESRVEAKVTVNVTKDKASKNISDKVNKSLKNDMREMNNYSGSILKNFTKLASQTSIIGWAKLIKETTEDIIELASAQSEYIENLNLMKVAFGDTQQVAEGFINTLSSKIGFDDSTMTRQLGIFRQISSAMGYASETSDLLSKNLTKLQLDISSLYNTSIERAGKALESAITGQVRSIRSLTGADITLATLQQEALARGIDKTVSEMNRAEKTILIYLSLERQLANANGDLSRTINSVANQTKIFKDQIAIAGRQIGAFFIPILKNVLPVLNGILMAFNEITKVILGIFHIDASSLADEFGTASGGIELIEDGLDGVSEASDKAKKSLRGFDKLNNISTPTASGGSGGVAGGGGIGAVDNKLLDALSKYDGKLDSIKNKATKIRDKIMETLGFHKELNEETGEWEWKYDGVGTTIKNLKKWFENLNPKAKILVGFLTTMAGIKLFNGIKKLVGAFSKTGLFKWVSNLLSPMGKLKDNLASMDGFSFKKLGSSIDAWKDSLSFADKLKNTIVGGVGIVAGLGMTRDGIKKIAEEGANAGNVIETALGGVTTILSGGYIGATFGGATGGIIGTALAGIAVVVTALTTIDEALNTNMDSIRKNQEKIDEMYNDWKDGINDVKQTMEEADAEKNWYQGIWEELQKITDENGKVQDGYEARAKFITGKLSEALGIEIKMTDGVIENYDELRSSIRKAIDEKYTMIKLQSLEEQATKAIKKSTEAEKTRKKALEDVGIAYQNVANGLKGQSEELGIAQSELADLVGGYTSVTEFAEKYNMTNKDARLLLSSLAWDLGPNVVNALADAKKAYGEADEQVQNYTDTINLWEQASELATAGQIEDLDLLLQHETYTLGESREDNAKYWEDLKTFSKNSLDTLEQNRQNYSDEDYERLKKQYTKEYDLATTEGDKLETFFKTKNGDISDETIKKWGEMATNSKDDFIKNFKDLPNDIQNQVVSKMKQQGIDISTEIQQGLDERGVTIKFDGDTTQVETKANTFFERIRSKVSTLLGGGIGAIFGGGSGGFRAEGGFVNSGDIFVANENNKPEYIGSFGNQTAVANTDQIVDGISIGVARAMKATQRDTNVTIEAKGNTSGLLNFITFEQQKKNRQFGL